MGEERPRHPRIGRLQPLEEAHEVRALDLAARQRAPAGPVAPHPREELVQPVHPALGELAERGDLAAEDVEQRRAAGLVEVEDIVARHRRGVALAVVEQRPHAGEGHDDVLAPQLLLEVAVHRRDQVVDLGLVRRHVLGPALVADVGGADQREIALVGVDEDHPLVVVLHQVGLPPLPELRHDDVAALDQPDVAAGVGARDPADEVVHPRAGGVDDHLRPHRPHLSGPLVAELGGPGAVLAPRADAGRAGQHLGALLGAPTAFSTTRRASSTQQSEYSKPRVYLSRSGAPSGSRRRSSARVPGSFLRPPRWS